MGTVSVVIPARNAEDDIRDCIACCLDQTVAATEIVVVDNGSSDRTASVATQAGARVLLEPLAGSYRARNRGWRATNADVVAFTDADCRPEPDWLQHILVPFSDPSVSGVGGEIRQAETNSLSQKWLSASDMISQAGNANHWFLPFFATANAAYRRSVLERVDGFDEIFYSGGDNDISWRIQMTTQSKLVYEPRAVVRHMVGPGFHELTARARRYGAGDALLDLRWSDYHGVVNPFSRVKPLWLLPIRLTRRLVERQSLWPPLIEAILVMNSELGRIEGKRDVRRRGLIVDLAFQSADEPSRAPLRTSRRFLRSRGDSADG